MRAVGQSAARLKEAAKLGFERAFLPKRGGRAEPKADRGAAAGLELIEIAHLQDLVALFTAGQRE